MRSTALSRAALAASAASLVLAGLAACGADRDPVATFRVIDETFRVELATPELVEHVHRLLDGEPVAAIQVGTVVRGDPGPNAPWSWHIDPATLEFAEVTVGVCDGLPSFVEDGTITSEQYCPWAAQVVSID